MEFFPTKCGGRENRSLFQWSVIPVKGSHVKDGGSWRSASCKDSVMPMSLLSEEGSSITRFQNGDLSPRKCRGWGLSRHNCVSWSIEPVFAVQFCWQMPVTGEWSWNLSTVTAPAQASEWILVDMQMKLSFLVIHRLPGSFQAKLWMQCNS